MADLERSNVSLRGFLLDSWNAYSPSTQAAPRIPNDTFYEARKCHFEGRPELGIPLLESHPDTGGDPDAQNLLGVMYTSVNAPVDGRRTLRTSIEQQREKLAITYANVANLEIREREWDEALEASRTAIAISPTTPHGWINLLFSLARTARYNEFSQAIDELDLVFPRWNQDPHMRKHLSDEIDLALKSNELLRHNLRTKLSL
ncbi:hypothetical protein [Reyranella sp.]|uniref:hypothetical protein n=1 Tax=Reyranella sp. TaxID=1929291 RepID=UPI003BA910AA